MKKAIVCAVMVIGALQAQVPVTNGLKFQVDASIPDSVITNTAGQVSEWRNLVDVSKSATQSTVSARPLYSATALMGKPGLVFSNALSQFLATGNIVCYSNHTIFVVAAVAIDGVDILGSGGTGVGDILMMRYLGKYRGHLWQTGAGGSVDSTSVPGGSGPIVYEQTANNTSLRILRNGTLDNTLGLAGTPSLALKQVRIGTRSNNSYLLGTVSEVLVYDRMLDETERKSVESYLMQKWLWVPPVNAGLMIHLDAEHPETIVKDGSGRVSSWKSDGLYSEVIQANLFQRPVYVTNVYNGRGAVRFARSETNCLIAATGFASYSNHTIVAMVRPMERNLFCDIIGSGGTGAGQILLSDSGGVLTGYYNGIGTFPETPPRPKNIYARPSILVQRYNGQTLELFNGITPSGSTNITLSTATLGGFSVGWRCSGGNGFGGDMMEIMLYNRPLTDAELLQLQGYLTDKWVPAELGEPPVMTGLHVRMDASAANSVITNSIGRVTEWKDLLAFAGSATTATETKRPFYRSSILNGRPAVRFNSMNREVLATHGTGVSYSNHTVFVVAQPTFHRGMDFVGNGGVPANGGFLLYWFSGALRGHYWNGSGVGGAVDSTNPDYSLRPQVVCQRVDDSALTIYRNGVLSGSLAVPTAPGINAKDLVLGCRAENESGPTFFDGELGEVLVYNRALSDAERLQVEAYLQTKWFVVSETSGVPVKQGLKLAADASRFDQLETNQTGRLAFIRDLSGNNNNLLMNNANVMPGYSRNSLRGRPAFVFGGTNWMVSDSVFNYSNHTVFVVARTSSKNVDLLGSGGTDSGNILLHVVSGSGIFRGHYWNAGSVLYSVDSSELASDGIPRIYSQRMDDATLTIYRNGISAVTKAKATETAALPLRRVIAGGRFTGSSTENLKGEIAEILVYDRALSTVERMQVETYLYDKWLTPLQKPTLIRLW